MFYIKNLIKGRIQQKCSTLFEKHVRYKINNQTDVLTYLKVKNVPFVNQRKVEAFPAAMFTLC